MPKDYYATLGVSPSATQEEIDQAYRRLATRYHHALNNRGHSFERLRDINEAWRVLSNPTQRAGYDRARRTGRPYHPPPVRSSVTPRIADSIEWPELRRRHRPWFTRAGALVLVLLLLVGVGTLLYFALLGERPEDLTALLPLNSTPLATEIVQTEEPTPEPDNECREGCTEPPPGCVVKGDIQGDAKLLFVPNDEGYAEVEIDPAEGERWFCTVGDAQEAGWTRLPPPPAPTELPSEVGMVTPTARQTLIVCAPTTVLRTGPGEVFPAIERLTNGTRVVVIGENGTWAVTTLDGITVFAPKLTLCTPTATPTRNPSLPAPTRVQPTAVIQAPTAVPNAPAGPSYPAPVLVTPSHGAIYKCTRELVLSWSFDGPALRADEWFVVESKPQERENWFAIAEWTKDTTVVLNPVRGGGSCDALWWGGNTGVYDWRVKVVRGDINTHRILEQLSPDSQVRQVNYTQ